MMKYLNPKNYLRFLENKLIKYRIRYFSPMRIVSKALGVNISLGKIEKTIESHGFQFFQKEEWKTEKHGTVNNILYVKNQQDHL